CSSPASEQSCPHGKAYRLQISGTAIREMLRHGILPPKEIVRPEAAAIAIQGVQPKGIGADGKGTMPVGKAVTGIFPYYLEHSRLGGPKRAEPLKVEDLTLRDLEQANLDTRANAGRIYREIHREYSEWADHDVNLQE